MNKGMRKLLEKLWRFIDFCICIYFFPASGINLIRFSGIKGFNSNVDKFFLYVISKDLLVEGDILEIGSFMGSSSILLAAGNQLYPMNGKVWLVEPYPKPSKDRFLNIFISHGLDKRIELIDKTSKDARKIIDTRFRFIFIDGNHEYEYVKEDILLWQDCLNGGGIIAFHDYWWEGVSKAIKELIYESGRFTILGTLGNILYACQGNFSNTHLLYQLRKLGEVREKLIYLAGMFGFKKAL